MWLKTRRRIAIIPLIICFFAAGTFLFLGYETNPFTPKIFEQTTQPKSITGLTEFDLPPILPDQSEKTVQVFCNITSTNFVVGEPILVDFELQIPSTEVYRITSITINPHNAIRPSSLEYLDEPPTASRFYLEWTDSKTMYEIWSGQDETVFQAAGTLDITLDFLRFLNDKYVNMINNTNYDPKFSTDITIESIIIETGEVIQQERNENLNLSLTYLVLFLATIEITIAIYDRSEDQNKKKYYEKKKQEQQQYNDANPDQDIIY